MEEFKSLLVKAIGVAKGVGLSDSAVAALATRLGDFLARFADPADREQRLLKELWDVGTEAERQALARMIAKMVVQERTQH